jgi:purine-nucleoside phosphorylase
MTDPENPFTRAANAADALRGLAGVPDFDVAVVLGSGWHAAADAIGVPQQEITLSDIPGWPIPTVPGHVPTARYIAAGDQRVLVFQGRVHLYEGLEPHDVVHAVRSAVAAGCRTVILTNAAGGIRADFGVGQPVLISDHLNLTGRSPLAGPPPPAGYPGRFTDLTTLYSPRLRALAKKADPALAEGVYAALPGPHYETPAEIRMLRAAGADLVGMSTALEAIAARHLGADVLGISLVTNPAAGLSAAPLEHADVVRAAESSATRIGTLLSALLSGL